MKAHAQDSMEIVYLMNFIPWFGRHTGYEKLVSYMEKEDVRTRVYRPRPGLGPYAVGKTVSLLRGHGRLPQNEAFVRACAEWDLRRNKRRLAHLIYGERHVAYWKDAPLPVRERSLLSLHQPPSVWSEFEARALSHFQHVIVLWQKDIDWFQSRLGLGVVSFIHHGVDIDFFAPAERALAPSSTIRLLYAGVHLRNLPMLGRIIRILSQRRNDIEFDLLIPVDRRSDPILTELQANPRVVWHANLNDDQLRNLYRQAHLLVLPMNDSGANTAVIEALSCGLPIVTTDVGGIRDYGGGTVFPIVDNNDDDAMVGQIEDYIARPTLRQETSVRCRSFAETQLAWPLIVQKHLDLYRKIMR